MTTRSWIRKPCTIRKAAARCRPALEALEDRTVPSTFTDLNLNDPVTGVTYYPTNVQVKGSAVAGWQGIRNSDTSGQYLITATAGENGVLFDGPITGNSSPDTVYQVNYPGAQVKATSVYGPDNLPGDDIRLVGTYRNDDFATAPVTVNGFLFEGTVRDLPDAGHYRTIDYPGAQFNYVHSTMGGLAVGNYDNPADHGKFGLLPGPGHAFLYDIAQDKFLTDIVFPGSLSNTAYGIWYNGGTSYTICGGYSRTAVNNFDDPERPIGQGYLVDYDSATGEFSNWASYEYPGGINFLTHFEGISSVEKGIYTLSADSVQIGSANLGQGSWVSVRRNTDGSFGTSVWVDLNYPDTHGITGSDSVYGNQVVGIILGPGGFAYQATVNIGFQLSDPVTPPGRSTVGVFDPLSATWYLRASNSPGAPSIAPFAFGAPGWISVVGDWDGDGIKTIGVVDPSTMTWYLRNSNSPGAPDIPPFQYGAPGDIPVVGDWNGDGIDTVGVFDPFVRYGHPAATWYLRNSNSEGPPDIPLFQYGAPDWVPVVGDWNGDGVTTVGVFDPIGQFGQPPATWYLRNSNSPGAPDFAPFAYGGAGWRPVVGDWDGDGITTIGVVNPLGTWYQRNSNSPGAPSVAPIAYGAPGWTPVTGDWERPALAPRKEEDPKASTAERHPAAASRANAQEAALDRLFADSTLQGDALGIGFATA
jgi:hypothetical protein